MYTILLSVLGSIASPQSEALSEPFLQQLPQQESRQTARGWLPELPLNFVANRGQFKDESLRFVLAGRTQTIGFTPQGLRFVFHGPDRPESSGWRSDLEFVVAQRPIEPHGAAKQTTAFQYFHGEASQWVTEVPSFGRLVYREVWPGIDLVFQGTSSELKYEFHLAPGADPNVIRMRYRGVTGIELEADGALRIDNPIKSYRDQAPVAWQLIDGERRPVRVGFELVRSQRADCFDYGFEVASYDSTRALILDPAILVRSGYLGGTGEEAVFDCAVDAQGRMYVFGDTESGPASFPETVGPFLQPGGQVDAFVGRLNPQGTQFEYLGFLGGMETEQGDGAIAVDAQGRAHVIGTTESDAATFPVTVGPQLNYGGSADAFVARISADGTTLEYCGYVGGIGREHGYGITIDSQGRAHVCGYTESTETTFPVSVGPDLNFNGDRDGFVARIRADGTAFEYCGYVGGFFTDEAYVVALDSQDRAYLTGLTESDQTSFPVLGGPDLTYNGGEDVFIARVRSDGAALEYCGYLGGTGNDYANGLDVDATFRAHLFGSTESDQFSFPVVVGPDLTHNGAHDAFVARVDGNGTQLEYCGYLGGNRDEEGWRLRLDEVGNAYVVGGTLSRQNSFPVRIGPDLTFNGLIDGFVARVNLHGTALDFCGYLGGDQGDALIGLALGSDGECYLAGATLSDETSFPTLVGPDLSYNGLSDGFVAKLQSSPMTLDVQPDPLQAGASGQFDLYAGAPNTQTYLVYSLRGFGSTSVGSLGITLDLSQPVLAVGPTRTNAQGRLTWNLPIPNSVAGRTVWLQAAQTGRTSNVFVASVQ